MDPACKSPACMPRIILGHSARFIEHMSKVLPDLCSQPILSQYTFQKTRRSFKVCNKQLKISKYNETYLMACQAIKVPTVTIFLLIPSNSQINGHEDCTMCNGLPWESNLGDKTIW